MLAMRNLQLPFRMHRLVPGARFLRVTCFARRPRARRLPPASAARRALPTVGDRGCLRSAMRSPASQQLAALEREVGMRLTGRAGRGIELTPAAAILVAHTDALLARLDAAESDLAALRNQVAGRVTLAAFPRRAPRSCPRPGRAGPVPPPRAARPDRDGAGRVAARRAARRDRRRRRARLRPAAAPARPALRAARAGPRSGPAGRSGQLPAGRPGGPPAEPWPASRSWPPGPAPAARR